MLQTQPDEECTIWQERARDLNWASLEYFSAFRDRIPGEDYGQSRFSVDPGDIDWGQYDIVISLDVAVPARITQKHPQTAWCYYVREIKAPSYSRGLAHPASGYDLFLNHGFRIPRPRNLPAHVVEFPYHLHHVGCFHELFGGDFGAERKGVFIDHHTHRLCTAAQLEQLGEFGPTSAIEGPADVAASHGHSLRNRRTMDPEVRARMMTSKYFIITPGARTVHGTAMVEAIAAGCLAIGSTRNSSSHGFFFSPGTSADSISLACDRMQRLEADDRMYRRELERQRAMVDWLCYTRPLTELLAAAERVVKSRGRPLNSKSSEIPVASA